MEITKVKPRRPHKCRRCNNPAPFDEDEGVCRCIFCGYAEPEQRRLYEFPECNKKETLVIKDFVMVAESRHRKHWAQDELQYLSDNYGVLTDETLASRFQRSECAIRLKARRGLRMHRWDNLYNAAELAEALGIPNASKIIRWVKKGYLNARRSSIRKGPYRHWKFSYTGIVRFIRRHPWLVVLKPTRRWLISDYSHHFFYIVRKEWKRDPWYTTERAACLLEVTAPTIRGYIHRGLLEAEKTPRRQSSVWVIRRSAIDLFPDEKQKEKEVANYG